jgi:hypothetical protein
MAVMYSDADVPLAAHISVTRFRLAVRIVRRATVAANGCVVTASYELYHFNPKPASALLITLLPLM